MRKHHAGLTHPDHSTASSPPRVAPTGDRLAPESVIGFNPQWVIDFTGMRTRFQESRNPRNRDVAKLVFSSPPGRPRLAFLAPPATASSCPALAAGQTPPSCPGQPARPSLRAPTCLRPLTAAVAAVAPAPQTPEPIGEGGWWAASYLEKDNSIAPSDSAFQRYPNFMKSTPRPTPNTYSARDFAEITVLPFRKVQNTTITPYLARPFAPTNSTPCNSNSTWSQVKLADGYLSPRLRTHANQWVGRDNSIAFEKSEMRPNRPLE